MLKLSPNFAGLNHFRNSSDWLSLERWKQIPGLEDFASHAIETSLYEPKFQVDEQRIIEKFLEDEELTRLEWRRLCWLIHVKAEGYENDISIFEVKEFERFYDHYRKEISAKLLSRSCFNGLVFCYFSASTDSKKYINFRYLKELVLMQWEKMTEKYQHLQNDPFYSSLFSDNPTKFLEEDFLHAISRAFDKLNEYIKIPFSSWFYDELVEKIVIRLSQKQLKNKDELQPLFERWFDKPIFEFLTEEREKKLLGALINLYARSPFRSQSDNFLKKLALSLLKNPQIHSNRINWKNAGVTDDGIQMVSQWCASYDLEFFFDALSSDGKTDRTRFNFWKKYIPYMSFTTLVFNGCKGFDSLPIKNFKQENKGRYAETQGRSDDNVDAFIMVIGYFVFVEFSQTSNACYYYHINQNVRLSWRDIPKAPFNFDQKYFFVRNELKGRNIGLSQTSPNRIIHGGSWQWNAAQLIKSLTGYYPNGR